MKRVGLQQSGGGGCSHIAFLAFGVLREKKRGADCQRLENGGQSQSPKNRIRHRLEKAARRTLREEEERKLTEEVMREMNDEKGK